MRTGGRAARRWLGGVAACGVMLGLTACDGNDPSPALTTAAAVTTPAPTTTAPSPTISPSPTADPSAVAEPTRPAEMDASGAEGAEAAAVYFVKLYPWVYQSGDLDTWNAMSGSNCSFCATVAASVADSVKSGEVNRGGNITIVSSRVAEPSSDYYTVEVHARATPTTTRDSAGSTTTSEGQDSILTIAVSGKAPNWTIEGVSARDVEE